MPTALDAMAGATLRSRQSRHDRFVRPPPRGAHLLCHVADTVLPAAGHSPKVRVQKKRTSRQGCHLACRAHFRDFLERFFEGIGQIEASQVSFFRARRHLGRLRRHTGWKYVQVKDFLGHRFPYL